VHVTQFKAPELAAFHLSKGNLLSVWLLALPVCLNASIKCPGCMLMLVFRGI
jgi:hypothetical protein